MATESTNRPSDTASSVADALATRNGLRYGSTTMFGMSRSRSVTAATRLHATNGSSASWPPALSHLWDGAGWSVNPMPSKPAASTAARVGDALAGDELGLVRVVISG